jgi:hypothetical protein
MHARAEGWTFMFMRDKDVSEKEFHWLYDAFCAGYRECANEDAGRVLGRIGGPRGGHARAERLSPERRKEIAKLAAQARWQRAAPSRREEDGRG